MSAPQVALHHSSTSRERSRAYEGEWTDLHDQSKEVYRPAILQRAGGLDDDVIQPAGREPVLVAVACFTQVGYSGTK